MGTGMARNMLQAGIPLRVWNRTRSRAEALAAEGAEVCSDPADAVRGADIIVTMLSDGPAVFESMTAAGPGLTAGQIWVQAATVGLAWLDELAELGRDRALVLIDAPVLGTRKPAEEGQLTVLAGGPDGASDSIRERVRPVFDAVGPHHRVAGRGGRGHPAQAGGEQLDHGAERRRRRNGRAGRGP